MTEGTHAGDTRGDPPSLAGELRTLREQVDWLLDEATEKASTSSEAVDWHTLHADQLRQAWDQLTCWVDWLTERYLLEQTVPACWYRHGPLVEELSALRAAWLGAYTGRPAAGDPAAWHDQFERTLARIRDWDKAGCAAGTHRSDVALPADERLLTERAEYLREQVNRRRETGPGRRAAADEDEDRGEL